MAGDLEGTGDLVGAVVTNWNDLEASLACLESLLMSSRPNILPILVDNGSAVDPTEAVARRMPAVRVVRLAVNAGYAAACNAGAEAALKAGASHLLLLNNDLSFESGFVDELLAGSRRHPGSILGPLVVYSDDPDRVWSAGGIVKRPWMDNRHLGEGRTRDSIQGGWVDWVPGCAMFVEATTWYHVGPIDQSYFLYLEDVDWCLNGRLRGVRTRLVEGAVVRHEVSRTTGRALADSSVLYYGCRNTHRLALKHSRNRSARARVWTTGGWSLAKAAARAALFPARRNDPLHRARVRALFDFLRGRGGPSPLPTRGFAATVDPVARARTA